MIETSLILLVTALSQDLHDAEAARPAAARVAETEPEAVPQGCRSETSPPPVQPKPAPKPPKPAPKPDPSGNGKRSSYDDPIEGA
jgi:hypothetical protein